MKYINTEKKVIKSWCNNPESGAIEQAKNLANLPFLFKHVALMPDTHLGYGMPIGGVIACENVVIPNAVGVDIGCGMAAVKTNLIIKNLYNGGVEKNIKTIIREIRKVIPVGFKRHTQMQDIDLMPDLDKHRYTKVCESLFDNARKQLGTLGGGNHFIEIQKDQNGYIWIMIHSGSRNLGKRVADYYNKVAKELNQTWISEVSSKVDLAFLPVEIYQARAYLAEMEFCLQFAKANRDLMMDRVKEIFVNHITDCKFEPTINIHHNYVRLENHFGKNVWVHRKGATSAKKDELGIIPGSQGSKSFIIKGKGERESFMSCSHGAGRKMGRKQACRELDLIKEKKLLDDQNIIHSIRNMKDLDEAAGAYKDINTVMEEQQDLIEILTELTPLGVIKG